MRHLRPVLILAALISLAVPATAGIGVFAGFTQPMGDLDDVADTGYHAGAKMHMPLVPMVLSAGPMIAYHDMPGSNENDSYTVLELMGTAKFSMVAGPQIIGGLGFSFPNGEIGSIDVDSDAEFTWMLGTGWSFYAPGPRGELAPPWGCEHADGFGGAGF